MSQESMTKQITKKEQKRAIQTDKKEKSQTGKHT